MKKAILVDLDGTLCNIDHRRQFALDGDFEKFYEGIPKDTVNVWCLEIINKFKKDYKIVIMTGRESTPQVFNDTLKWLQTNAIPFDLVVFRKEKDYRPDADIKRENYMNHVEKAYNVLFVLDDRKQVVEMWRSLGLMVLQCAEGDY